MPCFTYREKKRYLFDKKQKQNYFPRKKTKKKFCKKQMRIIIQFVWKRKKIDINFFCFWNNFINQKYNFLSFQEKIEMYDLSWFEKKCYFKKLNAKKINRKFFLLKVNIMNLTFAVFFIRQWKYHVNITCFKILVSIIKILKIKIFLND